MKLKDLSGKLIVKPGQKVDLSKVDPDSTFGIEDKQEGLAILEKNRTRLDELQYVMYAEDRHALLVVVQGMDASGKDGTIRHVFSGVNPQGCRVTSFKTPSAEELDHDFLWRIHKVVPGRRELGIFNRSHYEDVLIVRVLNLVPEPVWSKRYEQINRFEKNLAENDVILLKFYLHIGKEEQKKRLEERLTDPQKNWKMNLEDLKIRGRWDDFMKAYEEALTRCSTDWAPWYIIPSDKNWYRNAVISHIIVETLESLDMKFPKPDFDPSKVVIP